MAFSAPVFAAAAVTAAGAILKFEAENALQDGPSYIKSGQPEGAVQSVAQAIARQSCRRYADGVPGLLDGAAVDFETVCRPYLDNIGYGTGPNIKKPFAGGQCDCSVYRVEFAIENTPEGGGPVQTAGPIVRRCRGPISAPVPSGVSGMCFGHRGARNFDSGTVPPCGNPDTTCLFTASAGTVSASVFTVTLVSGPDDCGNPPPEVEPPIPPVEPGPPVEPYNPGPTINVDLGVTINLDGSINVDLGVGPFIIAPFGRSSGPAGGGGDGGGDLAPGDVGEPFEFPGETGPGGDLFSEAPPGSVLVGLQINFISIPIFAKQYDVGVYRGVAYIYMGAGALLDQDYGGSMVRDGQFFFAEKDNLTTWRVRATVGYNLRVTPYYREVEE